ncbi:AAA family ATPase [Helicobacter cetorum]|uniref:AAA family ATPase n=1 Tax=Helicobacter cetorum TaxID=138563 RepID=UPI000CF1488D|nr:AAA family ATPase [Helicobacter cetorum]
MSYLYIFAGVNGAGKSIFYYNALESGFDYGKRINSDEIVKELGDWADSKDQTRAAKIALKLRNKYLNENISFNIETTLSGQSILNFIHKAKIKHYKIVLFYVGLESVELSKQRVKIRQEKKGHFIAFDILERRYTKSFENLKKILKLCDTIYLYDNSKHVENSQAQSFSQHNLIATLHHGVLENAPTKELQWVQTLFE